MTTPDSSSDRQIAYQELLNKYAADLAAPAPATESLPPEQEFKELTTSLIEVPPTPPVAAPPVIPDTPVIPSVAEESVSPPPMLPPPPLKLPHEVPPPHHRDITNSITRVMFYISLVIFLAVGSAVVYLALKINQSKTSLTTALASPTPVVASSLVLSPTSAIACILNGQRYEVNQTFAAADGCNTCTCQADLTIDCTQKDCSTVSPTPTINFNNYQNATFGFSLVFPTSWRNKYATTETAQGVIFNYISTTDSSVKAPLFTLSRLSTVDWQTAKSATPTATLISQNKSSDQVYVYIRSSDNPFTADKTKSAEFAKMVSQIKSIISTFKLIN